MSFAVDHCSSKPRLDKMVPEAIKFVGWTGNDGVIFEGASLSYFVVIVRLIHCRECRPRELDQWTERYAACLFYPCPLDNDAMA